MARKKSEYLTAEQEKFVRMEANGYTTAEIIWELYKLKKEDDPGLFHAYECKMSRWRDHKRYEEVWKDEVRKQDFGDYTKARRTLRRSMDDSDKWLAMQSAVNVLNNSGKRIYGSEDNTVTVQITGMPDIGSPDAE